MIIRTEPTPLLEIIRQAGIQEVEVCGNPQTMVTGLTGHAQSAEAGFVFVARRGTTTDSHHYAEEAIRLGATVIVAEGAVPAMPGATVVRVKSTREAIGPLAQAAAGSPAKKLKVIGVTGTNGKTTTTFIAEKILETAGVGVARIGTLGSAWTGGREGATNTTPGPVELAALMARMVEGGVQAVAMEVSSHGIDQMRIGGIPFAACALTNITQDHLDYHGTYENYVACKKSLFTQTLAGIPGALSLLNLDDPVGEELAREVKRGAVGFSRGTERQSEIMADEIVCGPNFTEFALRIHGEIGRVRSSLVGGFNITNMLAAAGLCHAVGLDVRSIADGLSQFVSVPGRFERIDEGQPFTVLVDYAHTPDALSRVIRAARRLSHNRLITVFGCGGNRDQGKRPLMGRASGLLSDYVIIANDNPRDEDPEEIARHIVEGILQARMKPARFQTILDRRQAIESAIGLASPGDVVLIAGKGHETTQETRGMRVPFDDRAVAREILKASSSRYSIPGIDAADPLSIHRGEEV